ncbi:MAG TPA: ATP-dependent DNA ligase [Anaerolineae bacterium]|nr:ATP-dependent DNA ligase [Anaerolineae bacterium]
MAPTPFARLASLGERLEATSKRLELTDLVAGFLQELQPAEIRPAVRLTIGHVFAEWDDRALNISVGAAMRVLDELVDAAPEVRDRVSAQAVDPGHRAYLLLDVARRSPPLSPPLTILDVFQAFERIAETSGRGSRAQKEALLRALLERATAIEAKYLVRIIFQEMRHGVSEGVMLNGIAKAAGVKAALVRRANQLWGEVGEVALVALTEGSQGLRKATLRLFRPIKPMLAQTAGSYEEPFQRFEDRVALEFKLDGARVQIHRRGDEVHIYSRNLSDVTESLPDVVAEIRAKLGAREAIVEGEAVAVDGEGRPLPFQHLMRRFRRKYDIATATEEIPVQLYLFDALYLDGASLMDAANQQRWLALEKAMGGADLVRRLVPADAEQAEAFAKEAQRAGHEGVMAKDLESTYTPGVRGKSWLKLKHVTSLDLVVVAADWGYGRRHGWLSNYHLAVRDGRSGEFLVVGKTYKGLTDDQFREMTGRLLELEESRAKGTVFVQPRIVVEVLFNEIQESSQYKSRYALRFARISRIRDDKRAAEADTLQALQELYEDQFRYKGRLE